jgi:acetylornithine deacetylase/succinyl-diaminopimelate desuccinylase-like protein
MIRKPDKRIFMDTTKMPQTDFSTLFGLVSQYSPSGEEHSAVAWLVTQMKVLGYDNAFIDEAGNAVGIMGVDQAVVLLGHIDTVPGEKKLLTITLCFMAAAQWTQKSAVMFCGCRRE